jgi:hypothetical protein
VKESGGPLCFRMRPDASHITAFFSAERLHLRTRLHLRICLQLSTSASAELGFRSQVREDGSSDDVERSRSCRV